MPEPFLKDAKFWRGQISQALEERRAHEPWWDANLRAYAPRTTETPERWGSDVNTNRDFTLVERKKADLFYQRPEVTAAPTPLMDLPIVDSSTGQPILGPPSTPGQPGTPIPGTVGVQAQQEIVNEYLGPDEIDATRMVHRVLFDILCTQGVGFTKMGYESVTVPQDVPDPQWQPNPLVPPEIPQSAPTISVPVPIHEHCFWTHVSGKKILIPKDFRSTDWDKAPWLGYQFELPLTEANRQKYHLDPDFTGTPADSQSYYDHGTSTTVSGTDVFTGVELWYRSCLYRSDVKHPDHFTHLVLVNGKDDPAIEENSPDQTLDPRGGLTPDSLIGFPVHPLNMRTLPDSSFPPSDCTIIRPLVNELNRFREQMVEYRDAQTLRWMYNTDTMPPDALAKIVRSPVGGMIGVPGEVYQTEGIKELPHGSMPRESFTSNDYIDNDIARSTAIDAGGAGVQSQGNPTATEMQVVQANANARLDFERGVVLQWYCQGVTKFATLLQRYLPVTEAAQIIGPARAAIWDVWRKAVPSRLAFTAMPDSALRVDQAVDRKHAQDLYSFLANDPYIANGRQKLLEKLLRKYHIDPTGIVSPPNPPKPEPPKLAFSFKGGDLVGPQAPIVLGIAQQLGLTIDPAWVTLSQAALQRDQHLAAQAEVDKVVAQQANTTHGGKLAQQESLSKHAADLTGGMQQTGAPAALGHAGGVQ